MCSKCSHDLTATGRYDSEVGYCQGLPFVVAILLLNVSLSLKFGVFTQGLRHIDARRRSVLPPRKVDAFLRPSGSFPARNAQTTTTDGTYFGLIRITSMLIYAAVPGIFATIATTTGAYCLKFDRLVEEVLPVLHFHFIRQGIKSSMYCSQWFLTMFSYK